MFVCVQWEWWNLVSTRQQYQRGRSTFTSVWDSVIGSTFGLASVLSVGSSCSDDNSPVQPQPYHSELPNLCSVVPFQPILDYVPIFEWRLPSCYVLGSGEGKVQDAANNCGYGCYQQEQQVRERQHEKCGDFKIPTEHDIKQIEEEHVDGYQEHPEGEQSQLFYLL